ncbi:unnamed protein product [Vitrella brassicaformis CCMP3155]|uniref:Uncharacterized protein n=2 Tax=Vitrella brassicaformis TaxID=1169539 RepID=A0A0G4GPY6_VITBC|nr:unnamed protein product [Vitrella brassicaformis CCMP3155]|mmetsp:Transcript_25834/g.64115  ORF Transcript_25834/g.64115 Transcript_25834/m.64115 type:complete len:106 (+) Transcript_25834:31-348(+)|eukprot:CEM32434.1 unnamed protein product [Vitrella brassicaformis CCMP3155]
MAQQPQCPPCLTGSTGRQLTEKSHKKGCTGGTGDVVVGGVEQVFAVLAEEMRLFSSTELNFILRAHLNHSLCPCHREWLIDRLHRSPCSMLCSSSSSSGLGSNAQ